MKLAIIVLHFGDLAITRSCIESILPFKQEFSYLVLVNNDPKIHAEDHFPHDKKIIFLNSHKNVGFSAGVNNGIQIALKKDAEAILLLNNDTKIKNDIFSPLLDALKQDRDAGIVGPVIKFRKNEEVFYDYGGYISRWMGKTRHDEKDHFRRTVPIKVPYVSGCAMMIKREVFEKIGYFDEKYFMYYEDVDFCLRAAEEEYGTFVITDAVVKHELGASSRAFPTNTMYHLIRSRILFRRSHHFLLGFLFDFYQSIIFSLKNPAAILKIVSAWK
jgi:GT2 family glycosyltransferase